MVMEVAVQTIGEGRCGTFRVEADNATRAALAAIKQAIRSERQPLGAVGVLAEIRDSATHGSYRRMRFSAGTEKRSVFPSHTGPSVAPLKGPATSSNFHSVAMASPSSIDDGSWQLEH